MIGQTWIAGASGLIGSALLRAMESDKNFAVLTALNRRPLSLSATRVNEAIVDFSNLGVADLPAPDLVFCALGTTIRKAGSQSAFRLVDHDYVLNLAKAAQAAGVQHFMVISALGADADSRIFYNRVKGEMEAALAELSLPRLTILRPSLLLGDRAEFRLGERIAALLSGLIPARHKPVHADAVVKVMIHLALEQGDGIRIVENPEIHALAQQA